MISENVNYDEKKDKGSFLNNTTKYRLLNGLCLIIQILFKKWLLLFFYFLTIIIFSLIFRI